MNHTMEALDLFERCGLSPKKQVTLLLEYLEKSDGFEQFFTHALSKHQPIDMEGKVLIEIQRRVHMIAEEVMTYAIPEDGYRNRLAISGFSEESAFSDIRDSSYNGECVRLSYHLTPDEITEVHSNEVHEV